MKFCFFGFLLISQAVFGDIGSEVNKWFNDFKNNANVTQPQKIKSESSYHLSAGSYVSRSKTREVFEVAKFDAPRMSAGCDGVDMYFGGFSFIDAEEFLDMLKQVADNGTGLIFMMGIKYVSPMFAEQIEYIQGIVSKINKFRQNSCQAATAMFGGISKAMGRENIACELTKMNEQGEDWADAKKKCQDEASRTNNAPNRTVEEKLRYNFIAGNLTWLAIKDAGLPSHYDKKYLNLIMNVVGTVIRTNNSDASKDVPYTDREIVPMFSRSGDVNKRLDDVIRILVNGSSGEGEVIIDICDNSDWEDCLKLKDGKEKLSGIEGVKKKIDDVIKSVIIKMRGDEEFSYAEFEMLGQFEIPIYPLLRYALAYNNGRFSIMGEGVYSEYTKTMAEIIVIKNILDVMQIVLEFGNNLDDPVRGVDKVQKWLRQVEAGHGALSKIARSKEDWHKKRMKAIEQIEKYKQQITAKMAKRFVLASGWSSNK